MVYLDLPKSVYDDLKERDIPLAYYEVDGRYHIAFDQDAIPYPKGTAGDILKGIVSAIIAANPRLTQVPEGLAAVKGFAKPTAPHMGVSDAD